MTMHTHHDESTPLGDSDIEQQFEAETGREPLPMLPVDVRLIEAAHVQELPPRTILTDQVQIAAAPASPVRVAGELRTRASLILTPRGGDVYLGQGVMASAGTGYLLKADTSITIKATDAVWAQAASVACSVHVFAEIREG